MPADINTYALSMELAIATSPALAAIKKITGAVGGIEEKIASISSKIAKVFEAPRRINIEAKLPELDMPTKSMLDVRISKESLSAYREKLTGATTLAIEKGSRKAKIGVRSASIDVGVDILEKSKALLDQKLYENLSLVVRRAVADGLQPLDDITKSVGDLGDYLYPGIANSVKDAMKEGLDGKKLGIESIGVPITIDPASKALLDESLMMNISGTVKRAIEQGLKTADVKLDPKPITDDVKKATEEGARKGASEAKPTLDLGGLLKDVAGDIKKAIEEGVKGAVGAVLPSMADFATNISNLIKTAIESGMRAVHPEPTGEGPAKLAAAKRAAAQPVSFDLDLAESMANIAAMGLQVTDLREHMDEWNIPLEDVNKLQDVYSAKLVQLQAHFRGFDRELKNNEALVKDALEGRRKLNAEELEKVIQILEVMELRATKEAEYGPEMIKRLGLEQDLYESVAGRLTLLKAEQERAEEMEKHMRRMKETFGSIKEALHDPLGFLFKSIVKNSQVVQGAVKGMNRYIEGFQLRMAAGFDNVASIATRGGRALMRGFTNAIRDPGSVVRGVTRLVQRIRNFFPSSDAKEGPLKDLTKSGKAFMKMFSKGLKAEIGNPLKTLKKFGTSIMDVFSKSLKEGEGKPGMTFGNVLQNIFKGVFGIMDDKEKEMKKETGDITKAMEPLAKAPEIQPPQAPATDPAGTNFKVFMQNIGEGIKSFSQAVAEIPWSAILKLAVIGVIILAMSAALIWLASWLAEMGAMGIAALLAISVAMIAFSISVVILATAVQMLAATGPIGIAILIVVGLVLVGVLLAAGFAAKMMAEAVTQLMTAFTANIVGAFLFVAFLWALAATLVTLGATFVLFGTLLVTGMALIAVAVAIGAALLIPAVLFAITMTIIAGGIAVFGAAMLLLATATSLMGQALMQIGQGFIMVAVGAAMFTVMIIAFFAGMALAMALLAPAVAIGIVAAMGLMVFAAMLMPAMILLAAATWWGEDAIIRLQAFATAIQGLAAGLSALGTDFADKIISIAKGLKEFSGVTIDPMTMFSLLLAIPVLTMLSVVVDILASAMQKLSSAGTNIITDMVDNIVAKEADFAKAADIIETFADRMEFAFDKMSRRAVAGPFNAMMTERAETVTTVQLTDATARKTGDQNKASLDSLTAIKDTLDTIGAKLDETAAAGIYKLLEKHLPAIAEGRVGGLVDEINTWKR